MTTMLDSLNEFETQLVNTVVAPWQSACSDSPYPWMATPDLRKQWLSLSKDKDALKQVCGAIGLARCVKLTEEETTAVNEFFNNPPPEEIIETEALLIYLLSGGSPPEILLSNFFHPQVTGSLPPQPGFWIFYANFLRHPNLIHIAQEFFEKTKDIAFLHYCCFLNPCFDLSKATIDSAVMNNPWFDAVKIFHSNLPRPDYSDIAHEKLQQFAYLLRLDTSKEEFKKLNRDILLDDPFFLAQLHNPLATQGESPVIDHKNPHIDVLRYFGTESLVCGLWRYYNPLLHFPWMIDDISNIRDSGIYLGLLLFGMPAFEASAFSCYNNNFTNKLIHQHPSWSLCETYFQYMKSLDAKDSDNPKDLRPGSASTTESSTQ